MFSGLRSLNEFQLETDVLPMNDVVFVAVVYTSKYLLHKNCCVFLSELALCDDLVEELSSLADSKLD